MERKVSYKKLWHLLIDKDLKKTDLKDLAGISSSTLANIAADKHVSMDVLERICSALNCNAGDIMDFLPDQNQEIKK